MVEVGCDPGTMHSESLPAMRYRNTTTWNALLRSVLLGRVLLGRVLLGRVLLGRVLLGRVLLGRVLLGSALFASSAFAAGPPTDSAPHGDASRIQVELQADEGAKCPTTAELRAQVNACLAPAPKGHICPRAHATVRVLQSASSLDGRIRLRAGDRQLGERRLIGQRSCKQVVAAAALAICIGLDAMCSAPVPVSPRRMQHAPPHRQDRLGAVGTLPASAGPRIGIAVFGARGAAPATSAGLGLSIATATWPWRFAAEARIDAPSTAAFQGGKIGASLALGGLSVCRSVASVSICGVQYAGFKHFFGLGFPREIESWNRYFASSLRVSWNVWKSGNTGASMWVQADVPWEVTPHEVLRPLSHGDAPQAGCEAFPTESRQVCQWRPPRIGVTVGLEIHRGGQ